MSTPTRFKGPPPHVGWWHASTTGLDRWRWWDGAAWSRPAFPHNSAMMAALHAQRHDDPRMQGAMLWDYHWPADGRVERVNPDNPQHVTGAVACRAPCGRAMCAFGCRRVV